MAHFAQLDENNVVTQVVVVNNNEIESTKEVQVEDGSVNVVTTQSESAGVAFLQGIYGAGTNWKQTSYSASFRGKYAGIGDTFDGTNFVAPVTDSEGTQGSPVSIEETCPAPDANTPVPPPVLDTDQIDGTAGITVSPAETTGTVTIETSNTGV